MADSATNALCQEISMMILRHVVPDGKTKLLSQENQVDMISIALMVVSGMIHSCATDQEQCVIISEGAGEFLISQAECWDEIKKRGRKQ